MSAREEYPFAFGDGAADAFKERLKELMRAQQAAFEEVQAESGPRPSGGSAVDQAIALASAGLSALTPRNSPEEAADAMGIIFARAMAAVSGAARPAR